MVKYSNREDDEVVYNHKSGRLNRLVYNQKSEGICLCIATSYVLTCMYRLKYLKKIKRYGMSRRRVNKLRNFVLSPQPLIDMGVKSLDSASYVITDSRFGLQLNTSYRFARIRGESKYQKGNRYLVDATKIYYGENLIKCKLEKHFGLQGPKYPVVGCVFRGSLNCKNAREAFEKKPFFHETVGEAQMRPNHAIVIMGINTDGEPKDHYVEIMNSYGIKWGIGGYTKVVFKYIRNIMIPYFNKKVSSNGLKISTKKNANSSKESIEVVAKHLKPSVAGFLMEKEHDYLNGAVSNPKKPFAAIIGGSKLSTKIDVIELLLNKVDILILGGGMIFTFYKSQGLEVGSSLVEEDKLDIATSLLEKAQAKGVSLLLPSDVVIADTFASDAKCKTVSASSIPDGWMGLDIGPDSIKSFSESLDNTKTVIWIGPMGAFEVEKFAAGTEAIAHKLADLSGKGVSTIVGGGDLVAAVEKVGLADKMSYISTGGGASLEHIEGKPLPGVVALDEN